MSFKIQLYKDIDSGGSLNSYVEVENLDIPGIDNFTEHNGVYFTFQPNINSQVPGDGRWIITDNITNPMIANQAYYYDAYWRLDQAIEDFKKKFK